MDNFLAVEPGPEGAPFRLSAPLTEGHRRVAAYHPAEGLVEAMDVAMMLGVPLLLTGEPGTGKTQAAYWLADKLRRPLLKYDVKSVTSGADLLYSFDEVARFRDASAREMQPLVRYLRFNALGLAILRGSGGAGLLTDMLGEPLTSEAMQRVFGRVLEQPPSAALLLPDNPSFATSAPEHCVVLIDELDKAPRDTPNDLLAEVETMRFSIPELGIRVPAASHRPIVVLTSNSERSLPEPFLRRCAYFDIPFPREAALAEIVSDALNGDSFQQADTPKLSKDSKLLSSAVTAFLKIHDNPQMRKKPGTAELLDWVDILLHRQHLSPDEPLGRAWARSKEAKEAIERTLCALVKSRDDREIGLDALRTAPAT